MMIRAKMSTFPTPSSVIRIYGFAFGSGSALIAKDGLRVIIHCKSCSFV